MDWEDVDASNSGIDDCGLSIDDAVVVAAAAATAADDVVIVLPLLDSLDDSPPPALALRVCFCFFAIVLCMVNFEQLLVTECPLFRIK